MKRVKTAGSRARTAKATPPKASRPPLKKTSKKPPAVKKASGKKIAPQRRAPKALEPLDLSSFPQEAVSQTEITICLACVLEVFTRHLGLAARTAHLEVKRYTPSLAELAAGVATRPYFNPESEKDACPYCGSAPKWHARLRVSRIESGKATDALRRELIKSLPAADDQFVVIEEKATQQLAFFEWLEKVGA